jgi:hypothetical protein
MFDEGLIDRDFCGKNGFHVCGAWYNHRADFRKDCVVGTGKSVDCFLATGIEFRVMDNAGRQR